LFLFARFASDGRTIFSFATLIEHIINLTAINRVFETTAGRIFVDVKDFASVEFTRAFAVQNFEF